MGGAIFNQGTLSIQNSTVTSNVAVGGNGKSALPGYGHYGAGVGLGDATGFGGSLGGSFGVQRRGWSGQRP